MARVADSPWLGVARQARRDLLPFPGRLAMTWRVALLCAIVAGVAMVWKIPESALSCYLIIFLARPNGAECVGQAIGLILLATVVVFAMAPVIEATADSPMLRIAVIALTSFGFIYLGAASQVGEIGSIIALVIAFILTLVDQVPAGQIVTRGLLDAWQMAVMPMALMIVFNLILGTSPHRLLRQTIAARVAAAADALDSPGRDDGLRQVGPPLEAGNDEAAQQILLARLFHTAPTATVNWLQGATLTSYRLLLAVAALPADAAAHTRQALAAQCRSAAEAIGLGRRPATAEGGAPIVESGPPLRVAAEALAGLSEPNGGSDAALPKPPFLASDAFINPDYQRFALKTTGAAISCYLIYSLIDWQGIHTAMVTCYVAALGTTAETVHKLALRIAGCLVGATMGFLAILFVIPHLESVGGLMAMVFCAVMVAAWVSSGNERISYAGVQIGLAFLLTTLNGFAPSLSMESGRDRVIGILLGNVMVYLFFTSFWPKSAAVEVRERIGRSLAALSRLAKMEPASRQDALGEAGTVETEAAKAEEQIRLLPFEPARERPSWQRIGELRALLDEMRSFLPALMFSPERDPAMPQRLAAAADQIRENARRRGGEAADPPEADDGGGNAPMDLDWRLGQIERLAEGRSG